MVFSVSIESLPALFAGCWWGWGWRASAAAQLSPALGQPALDLDAGEERGLARAMLARPVGHPAHAVAQVDLGADAEHAVQLGVV